MAFIYTTAHGISAAVLLKGSRSEGLLTFVARGIVARIVRRNRGRVIVARIVRRGRRRVIVARIVARTLKGYATYELRCEVEQVRRGPLGYPTCSSCRCRAGPSARPVVTSAPLSRRPELNETGPAAARAATR